jgi:hypothetical protein
MLLTPDQLENLTGYRRQAEQLAELHKRGFSRAYRDRLGKVVLTLAHYHAVESGAVVPARPKVRHRETTT